MIHESDGQRVFALALETGEEAMACLQRFAQAEQLSAGQFTAIGAFKSAEVGYFNWSNKSHTRNPVADQVEVASLIGDVATAQDGKPAIHAPVVLGRRDGSALSGQ